MSNNILKNTFIEFHILQSFPVTCLNRDDVGSPKSAVVGGVTRARVSSQAWKRPTRLAMQEFGVKIGIRTKSVAALIAKECILLGANEEQAASCAEAIAAFLSKDTLLFFTETEAKAFAEYAKNKDFKAKDFKAKEDGEKVKDLFKDSEIHKISKRVAALIARECILLDANEDQAASCAEAIAAFLSKDTLLSFTETEAKAFAEYAKNKDFKAKDFKAKEDGEKVKDLFKDSEIHKISKKAINPAIDGLDIALFGRMVAQSSDLRIEAAASFSHAISTHKASSEVDFFTAVDDIVVENSGAAHLGSLEFNSATYYRYVSLDLGQLHKSLNGERLAEAIESFVKALYVAVPSARQSTMSGASSWDYAKILVRKGQRLQLNFDAPVIARDGTGYLTPSIDRLEKDLAQKEKMSGSLFGKLAEIDMSSSNVDELIAKLQTFVTI